MSNIVDRPGRGAMPFSRFERKLAGRYMRARRAGGGVSLITVISFLGIMLAVMILIVVMSVMNGYRAKILDIMTAAQGHIFVYTTGLEIEDVEHLREQIAKMPEVTGARSMIFGQAAALSRGVQGGDLALVFGVEPSALDSLKIIKDNLVDGSLDGFGDGVNGGDDIIVGQGLAQHFGLMVGDDMTLLSFSGGRMTPFGTQPVRKTYRIGGIFKVGFSDIDQHVVYMPLSQADLFFNKKGMPDFIEVRVKDPYQTPRIQKEIKAIASKPVLTEDWLDKNRAFVAALQIERSMMRMILLLLVFIAALNIISGLVMLIKDKGRDIAILRTMGASKGAIMRVFIMVGASIGSLGTLAGVLGGILFAHYIGPIQDFIQWAFDLFSPGEELFNPEVYGLSRLPALIAWNEVAFIALFGFAASVLVTLYPSWRASRLDPVEALRYE